MNTSQNVVPVLRTCFALLYPYIFLCYLLFLELFRSPHVSSCYTSSFDEKNTLVFIFKLSVTLNYLFVPKNLLNCFICPYIATDITVHDCVLATE
jgi:hypothetical protein